MDGSSSVQIKCLSELVCPSQPGTSPFYRKFSLLIFTYSSIQSLSLTSSICECGCLFLPHPTPAFVVPASAPRPVPSHPRLSSPPPLSAPPVRPSRGHQVSILKTLSQPQVNLRRIALKWSILCYVIFTSTLKISVLKLVVLSYGLPH